jgi:3-oxoacyl-[acyl-carrier-protein] synthase III
MTPDARTYNETLEYFHDLIARIDKSQRWIAERIGISERRVRYLIAGSRDMEGKTVLVTMTYPEQFALEALASAAETMRQK